MLKKLYHAKSIMLLSIVLILSSLFTAACSQIEKEEQKETAIKTVLEHQFNGPDEKFMDLLMNPKYKTIVNNKEENPELDQYITDVYGPYFANAHLSSFMAKFGTQYPTYAYENGYELNLKKVTINQDENNEDYYTFLAEVGYKKKADEEKTTNVEGEVVFSSKEEGKIEGFRYTNDHGLSDMLRGSH